MGVLDVREPGGRLRPSRHCGAQIQLQDQRSKRMQQNRIKYALRVWRRRARVSSKNGGDGRGRATRTRAAVATAAAARPAPIGRG
jgi:hypothetical protein